MNLKTFKPSNLQTRIEPPSIELCGVRVFASRDGDRVTGRVEFPCPVGGKTHCPIDYRSRRPDPQSAIDNRAAARLKLVNAWHKLCTDNPGLTRKPLGERAIAETDTCLGRVTFRSLQNWARRLDTEGVDGLRDRYTKPPKRVLSLEAQQATDAVLVCAWWAFRIGNVDKIDNRQMAAAAGLITAGYCVADCLATIDCYYSYSCDRTRFPFKPFRRWARYDVEKWIMRACDQNDYRRAVAQDRKERVPLQAPATICPPQVPDPHTRKRQTLNRPTRSAIRNLAPQSSIPNPQSAIRNPQSAIHTAKALKGMGLASVARRITAGAAPGALVANKAPQTMAEAIGALDDGYRSMLIKVGQGDRTAFNQAVATMPLWWDRMPQQVRNNIDFRIDHGFRKEHTGAGDRECARRKLHMLVPHIRDHRMGTQRLGVAARLPV